MIIDSHCHIDIVPSLGWYDTADLLISRMDEAGIDRAVISGYLNAPGPDPDHLKTIAEAMAKYPGRFIGYARLDPWFADECIKELNHAYYDYGIRGVKLLPAHYTLYPYDSLTVDVVKRAGELKMPVLFHCGDEMMCLPYQIERLAKQCPQTVIIMAHLGGYFSGEAALRVCQRNSNVYLDTSEIPFPHMVKKAVKTVGARKVLYGSDAPCCDITLEIEKVRLAGLSQEEENFLYWKNISMIFEDYEAAL